MNDETPHNLRPLIGALRTLLRPLIRLLLARGLTYPMLLEELKRLYVEAADVALADSGRARNMSAVSLASGIHRKDVKRLLESDQVDERAPKGATLGARMFGVWLGDARYQDAQGRPLSLPRNGPDPSFEALVASVNRDVRPRAVLEEWLRLGLVELNEENRVVLCEEAFVPSQAEEEMLYYFGRNVRDHIAAGCHNLIDTSADPLFERALFYDRLTPESQAKLRAASREQGMALLRSLNQLAHHLAQQDEGKEGANRRITLGLYYYQERSDGEPHA